MIAEQLEYYIEQARRAAASRRDDLRRLLAEGCALPLADALEALPPDGPTNLATRLGTIAAAAAAGMVIGTALKVDPSNPLKRETIPPAAWPSARLVPGDFEFVLLDVLDGVRLYGVELRLASLPGGEPSGQPGALKTLHETSPNEVHGAEPGAAPLPGAMEAAATAIVEQGEPLSVEDCRIVFASFGLDLSEDGKVVQNPPETVIGDGKAGASGRRPSVARLLITASARRLVDDESSCRTATARALAQEALHCVARLVPELDLPTPKVAALYCASFAERATSQKPVGNKWQ